MSNLIVLLNCAFALADGTKCEAGQEAELGYSEATRLVNSGGAVVVRFVDEAPIKDVTPGIESAKRITKEGKGAATE